MTDLSPVVPPALPRDDRLDIPVLLTRLMQDLANDRLSRHALFVRLADAARQVVAASSASALEIVPGGFRVVPPSGDAPSGDAPSGDAPSGDAPIFDGATCPFARAPSLFHDVLESRQARLTNDAGGDPFIDALLQAPLGVRQLALAPILLAGEVVGLLACINPAHGAFTDADLALLDHVAAHGPMVMRTNALVRQAEAAATDARARAEDAARAAQVNAVLVKTARTLADATAPEALYRGLAEILVQELGADGFTVYSADLLSRTARCEHQWGVAGFARNRLEAAFWQSPFGEVVREATPMFIEDLSEASELDDIGAALVAAGGYSLALLPLVLEERVQGVLAIRYLGARVFDHDARELLTHLGTQVALAFRNTVQLGELERRADRFALLARAQQQLTQLTSEESLPQAIAEAVQLVIPSAVIDVLAISPDGLQRVLHMEAGRVISTDPVLVPDTLLARETALTGVPRLASHLEPGADVARTTMELCAAVRFGQRSAGVIRLLGVKRDAFVMQDLDLLTIIARHAGTAVETARLFALQDFQRQRAEGAAELARVTLQAATLAEGATELLQVLDRYVPSIGKAIGVTRARDGQLEYVATSGTLDVFKGQRPSGARSVVRLAPDGRSIELESMRDVAPAGLAETLPDEWALAVPLSARDRSLGILLVTAPRAAPLRQRDRITLERLSASLALALDALLLDDEERLAREREQLLATALTTIDHPIFVLDLVGVRYANPAAAREYGWSQVELMEMQFAQFVAGQDPHTGLLEADGLRDPGIRLSNDLHRRRDGSEFPAAVTISALTAHDGDLLGQVVSVRNVSQDRRLEEQLRHTEKMVALGELVAGVAHEINNPLTGISAFAQLLLEKELGDDHRESVQLIKQECDRAKTVVKDLLLFARETERGTGPVDINAVIEQTLRLRAYPLRNAGVHVERQLDPSGPQVAGDAQTLQQVLLNVLANAEHAMMDRAERRLVVRTERDGDRVVILATDTGVGMTEEVRRRIFEPFFSTKPDGGAGTGLGLSVSYGIIHAHGGTIGVESEPDVGSTVTIVLPAASSDRL